MIVHVVDIRESGPNGLIGILEPHGFERSEAVEATRWETHLGGCCVEGCDRYSWSEVVIHRLHSRRLSETLYLCDEDMVRHRAGEPLRIRLESSL